MNPFNLRRFFPKSKPKDESARADLGLLPPTPIWSRVMIWTIGSGSIFLIIWSTFTRVEEIVMLQGEIATSKPAVQVKALDPGVIKSILIRPHEPVEFDQILIIYGDDETSLRLNSLKKRIELITAQSKIEMNMYDLRILKNQEQIQLDKDLLSRLTFLLKNGAIQETQVLEKQAKVTQGEIALSTLREEKQRSIHQTEQTIEELTNNIQELQMKSNRFTIKAHIDGFIKDVKYKYG